MGLFLKLSVLKEIGTDKCSVYEISDFFNEIFKLLFIEVIIRKNIYMLTQIFCNI